MNWTGLAYRLEKKFGLGDNPFAARRVYRHVERLCHQYGDPVYIIVRDMADYADTRSKPGNNFRAYVLDRIRQYGYDTEPPKANQSRPGQPPQPSPTAARDVIRTAADRFAEGIPNE